MKARFLRFIVNILTTLLEAQEWVDKNKYNGCICPCCNRPYKVYARPITANMAYALIKLYKMDKIKHDYYHLTEILANCSIYSSHDFGKLASFGLITPKPKEELPEFPRPRKKRRTKEEIQEDKESRKNKGRTSGCWMITDAGKLFVEGKMEIRKNAVIDNKRVIGDSGEKITIKQALEEHFDYEKLMNQQDPLIGTLIKSPRKKKQRGIKNKKQCDY